MTKIEEKNKYEILQKGKGLKFVKIKKCLEF